MGNTMALTLNIVPGCSTDAMLRGGIGTDEKMLSCRVEESVRDFFQNLAFDQAERIAIAQESTSLQQLSRDYQEFTGWDVLTSFTGGLGWGIVGWVGGPITGLFTGYLATGMIGCSLEETWKLKNRKTSQQIVLEVAKIGLERMRRLGQKREALEACKQDIERQNNELLAESEASIQEGSAPDEPSGFRSWFSWTRSAGSIAPSSRRRLTLEARNRLITQIARNTLILKSIVKLDNHFEAGQRYYADRFQVGNVAGRQITLGHWQFALSIEENLLKIDRGRWVRNQIPGGSKYWGTHH